MLRMWGLGGMEGNTRGRPCSCFSRFNPQSSRAVTEKQVRSSTQLNSFSSGSLQVGGFGPQAEVCTASRTRRVVAALAGRGRVREALA